MDQSQKPNMSGDIILPSTPIAPSATPAGYKVLCIEDEHFIGELYTRALNKAGYQTELAFDGQDGLDKAKTDQFDIILLDIMIPTIKGTDVLRRLRDTKETPKLHAKIIITTNLEQGEEMRKQIEAQADGYIIKADVTPKELVDYLQKLKLA